MIQAPNRLRPLLGLATFALIGSPALAQDSSTGSAPTGAQPAWHTGYALIDDSHLSLHLRNLYKAGTSTPDAGLPPTTTPRSRPRHWISAAATGLAPSALTCPTTPH